MCRGTRNRTCIYRDMYRKVVVAWNEGMIGWVCC